MLIKNYNQFFLAYSFEYIIIIFLHYTNKDFRLMTFYSEQGFRVIRKNVPTFFKISFQIEKNVLRVKKIHILNN